MGIIVECDNCGAEYVAFDTEKNKGPFWHRVCDTCYMPMKVKNPFSQGGEVINRAKLRGEKLDEDCKYANTTTEADLCVCYGLIDNAENLLPKCKKCMALVWNAEKLILKRIKEADDGND